MTAEEENEADLALRREVTDFIDKLHKAGFAVTIWTPEEVDRSGVSVKHIEDCLISYGNEYFDMQGDD